MRCVYPCINCTSATSCRTCAGKLDNRKAAPYCTCEDGYYNRADECVKCPLPCVKCSNATTCTEYYSCDEGSSTLYKGYFTCHDCIYPCITCDTDKICITCNHEITNRHDPSSNN